MSKIEILSIDNFDREFRKLLKKYRSLAADLTSLLSEIRSNPVLGQALGKNVYKVRMAISAKNKGKSAGARIITYYVKDDGEVYLLSIYDKSDQASISDNKIMDLVREVSL